MYTKCLFGEESWSKRRRLAKRRRQLTIDRRRSWAAIKRHRRAFADGKR